jgi:hypothetical protein
MNAFGIELPSDMNTAISSAQNSYNGQNIVQQEKQREEETLRKVAEFRKKFVEQPHLELVFEKMNIHLIREISFRLKTGEMCT